MRALLTVQAIDPGIPCRRRADAADAAADAEVRQAWRRARPITRECCADVRALPGVTNAAFVSYLPMGRMRGGIWPVAVDGRAVQPNDNRSRSSGS